MTENSKDWKMAAAAVECANLGLGEAAADLAQQLKTKIAWLDAMGIETAYFGINPFHARFRRPSYWFRTSQFPLVQLWFENVPLWRRLPVTTERDTDTHPEGQDREDGLGS